MKTTTLSEVTATADAILFKLDKIKDSMEGPRPHRGSIPFDVQPDNMLAAVNAHLAMDGYAELTSGQWQSVRDEHTKLVNLKNQTPV